MKKIKVHQIVLVICSLTIGALMCYADSLNRKIDSMQQPCVTCEVGNEVENWILDVVYETDIFEDITPEETEILDFYEKESLGRYYIELILLYQKYYGNN